MTCNDLLAKLRRLGVVLSTTADGRLGYGAPPGAMTPQLRAALAEHKADVLTELEARRVRAGVPAATYGSELLDAVLDRFPGARCVAVRAAAAPTAAPTAGGTRA